MATTPTGTTKFDDIECLDIDADDIVCDDITCDAVTAGSLSLSTALAKASVGEASKRSIIPVLFSGTLVDGSTNIRSIPMPRSGTVKKIWIAAGTRMVGGTNTLAIAKKNGGTSANLLSTANVNPVNVPAAADVAEALTLTSTSADLAFVAGDNLITTLVCGTMTTDGANYSLSFEVEYNDT